MDSQSVAEGLQRALSNIPKGIPCWRDKGVTCGNFQSWDDFLKHDGEKFCKRHCKPKPDRKAKDAADRGFKYQQRYPKQGMAQRVFGIDRKRMRAYQVQERGRKVA